MVELQFDDLTSVQVGALRECIDLTRNGYIIRFAHYGVQFWFIRLIHSRNGRELFIRWYPDAFTIQEGDKILKRFPAN